MKFYFTAAFTRLLVFVGFAIAAAGQELEEGERLARIHCAACHGFPEPKLLPERSWKHLLMHMGLRLGVEDLKALEGATEVERTVIINRRNLLRRAGIIPENQAVTHEQWQLIRNFYLEAGPAEAIPQKGKLEVRHDLELFEVRATPYQRKAAMISMVHIDEANGQIIAGDSGYERLIGLDRNLDLKFEHVTKGSLWVRALTRGEDVHLLSIGDLMGRFGDERMGKLFYGVNKEGAYQGKGMALLDLHRPADIGFGDFDGDGEQELVVCNFGNVTGSVDIHQPIVWRFRQEPYITLAREQGAVDCEVADFDGNGLADVAVLFGNARENLSLFLNQGDGRFERKVIVEEHAAFGYTAFKWVDHDSDGDLDVWTINGDNVDADPFNTLRPYHGIRLYLNDGKLGFTEAHFFPLYGAYGLEVEDFDLDGDLDLAAISFNPDFSNQENFMYYENKGKGDYVARTMKFPESDRWLTMDAGDFDGDGDKDLVLGGGYIDAGLSVDHPDLLDRMLHQGRSIVVIENKTR